MKKFLLALTIIFIVNLGCKKIIDSEKPCACSPVYYPSLNLVIKNAAGDDYLNTKTTGSFNKDNIQLYYKEANGNVKQVQFLIRQPFSYGSEQFKYFYLRSEEILSINNFSATVFYIKLGNNAAYELKIDFDKSKNKVEKLLINNNEAVAATGTLTNYQDGNMFYFTL